MKLTTSEVISMNTLLDSYEKLFCGYRPGKNEEDEDCYYCPECPFKLQNGECNLRKWKKNHHTTAIVDCEHCDGYEAGYSAGLKDTGRPLTALCDEYCKNCPITDKNDCKDCLIPKIRGFIRGQEK